MEEIRLALVSRLRERLPELQGAIATRVYAISDPHDVADPAYLQGLNTALAAAIDYRLAVLEVGELQAPAIPSVLLAQARLDARNGVSLDAVLRRYFAGNALFENFLLEEAERAEVPSSALRQLLGAQATLSDRLLAAVSHEHTRETKNRPSSPAERRRECVKALLAGELVDHSELGYDLDAHHLALMAKGEGRRSWCVRWRTRSAAACSLSAVRRSRSGPAGWAADASWDPRMLCERSPTMFRQACS